MPYTAFVSLRTGTPFFARQSLHQLTNTHDNAVAVSPRMKHVVIWFGHEITHHLNSLGSYELDVFFFTIRLGELLGNKLSELSPV